MSEYWERVHNIKQDNEQKRVFDEDVSRVVIAGPGSGKTYVLTTKIAKFLHENVVQMPYHLACLTYSNFLEKQLSADLQTLGVLNDERLFVGTVHSFCIAEIILPFQKLYRLNVPTPLRIASQEEQNRAIEYALNQQNIQPKINDIKKISYALNNYRRSYWDKTNQTSFPECPSSVSDIYPNLDWKKLSTDYSDFLKNNQHSFVDFIHLEIEALNAIQSYPLVRKLIAARYPWWIIDEYQDLSQLFHKMILCLIETTNIQLLVIGDPDQCIYEELQGCKPDSIFQLSNILVERGGAELVTLKTNYRSPQKIIDLSQIILRENRGYVAVDSMKHIQSICRIYNLVRPGLELSLIQKLLDDLITTKGVPLNQIAVLHPYRERKKHSCINQISYMLENKIKNQLDKDPQYNNRTDLVLWIEQLARWCANESITSKPYFVELIPKWIELVEHKQGYTRLEERFKHEKVLFEILWNLRDSTMKLNTWLDAIRTQLLSDDIINAYQIVNPGDANDLLDLYNAVKDEKRLQMWDIARFAKTGERIQLTTLHSSKGSEFEAVILAGFSEIGFGDRKYTPQPIDTRLAYVGITRAKKYLYLISSSDDSFASSGVVNRANQLVDIIEYDGRSQP